MDFGEEKILFQKELVRDSKGSDSEIQHNKAQLYSFSEVYAALFFLSFFSLFLFSSPASRSSVEAEKILCRFENIRRLLRSEVCQLNIS